MMEPAKPRRLSRSEALTPDHDSHSARSTPSRRPSKKSTTAPADPYSLNVLNAVLGDRIIIPYYPSLYREELIGTDKLEKLWVCERCFKYGVDGAKIWAHRRFCQSLDTMLDRVVYAKGRYSIHEVDGEEYRLFGQNLSLFSKLFIETKSVCFDVTTFLYYLLIDHGNGDINQDEDAADRTQMGPRSQIVGFFSKEKLSWDNNNLACILIFPPWQKRGLGQLLMGASYELSRREGRLGGPERPLSAPGAHSYLVYWCRAIASTILSSAANKPLSIGDITEATYMLPEDVVATLLHMGVLGARQKDGSIKVDRGEVSGWAQRHGVDLTPPVDADGFLEWEEEEDEEEEGPEDGGDDEEDEEEEEE